MAIEKGDAFKNKDVFIDYPFEEVMYRWDNSSKEIYVKFYGRSESNNTVSPDNRLFNEALQSGVEIDQKEYLSGKPREI